MTAAAGRRSVAWPRALAVSYRVLIRQILTPGRLIGLGLGGVVFVLIGWAVRSADAADRAADAADRAADAAVLAADAAVLASGVGLAFILPVFTLIFATAVLGQANEDGTLVYLWLRPMDRAPIVLGGLAAALSLAAPLVLAPVAGAAAAAGADARVIEAAAASALLGAAAYGAVFLAFSLVVKRSILWGLAYVLIWENIAPVLGDTAARLSLRNYTQSVLANLSGVGFEGLDPVATPVAVLVLAAVTVVAVALASARLSRLDVA